MKKIILLIFVLVCSRSFSQDSTSRSFNHLVGVEVLGTTGRVKSHNHFSSGTSYKPGYSLFYRAKYKRFLGIESRLLYRSGFGSRTDGGRGGSLTRRGDFEILRIDAGVLFSSKSDNEPSNCVFGFKVGRTLYQSGNIKQYGSGYGGSSESEISTASVLNQNYLSVHFGANFRIKVSRHHNISTGFRLYIETRDYEDASINLTLGLNAAYRFW